MLFDEVYKLFAWRIVRHLFRTGPDLVDNQYGCREVRFTVDAIIREGSGGGSSFSGIRVIFGHRQRLQHLALELR